MRRAHDKPTAVRRTTSTPPSSAREGTAVAGSRQFDAPPASSAQPPVNEVLLSPAGTFTAPAATDPEKSAERRRHLAASIRQRIEARLHGRVRHLVVRILGNKVVLEGQCATYYSKQLAQHAAIGILEDEQLENAIIVSVR